MTRILTIAAFLFFAIPSDAQRNPRFRFVQDSVRISQMQFCMKLAQLTHQPCRQVISDLRQFTANQPIVTINNPLNLLDADLHPLPVDIPRERFFHRRRHR
jgi:hypothetical protein